MHIMTIDGWRPLATPTLEKAKREGTFHPVPIDQAVQSNAIRIQMYEQNVGKYVNSTDDNPFSLEEIYHCWSAPVFGPFGERL